MNEEKGYKAIVERVIANGAHGPYAVARSPEIGIITFSLDPPVWQEEDIPERGMYVILSRIRKKPAGWRAKQARFLKPCDESKEASAYQQRLFEP
jgi:hypothetical protein